MQPQFTPNNRQRPLQKSMFLPQTQQYVQRNNNVEYQYQDMMKRSAIQPDPVKGMNFQEGNFIQSQKQQNFQFPNYTQTPTNQFNNNNGQILNFSNGIRYKENTRINQFQHQTIVQSQINQSSSVSQSNLLHQNLLTQVPVTQVGTDTLLQELQQKVNQLTQIVENHDQIIKKYPTSLAHTERDEQIYNQISQQIQNRLKQSFIPTLVSKETKQIYEHIFDFKLEIKTIRQEITSINDSFKSQIAAVLNHKSNSTVNSLQKIQKCEDSSLQVSKNFSTIQNKLAEIHKLLSVKNQNLKDFLLGQIEKVKKQVKDNDSQLKMKPSTIKSTLSPIIIEYRQLFAVKNNSQKSTANKLTSSSSPSKRQQRQIHINSSTYFIDREGFLLDSQNRYIVDQKGNQIKLDQRHLILLKQHNVLS